MHIVQIIDDLDIGGAQQTVLMFACGFDYANHQLTVISLTERSTLRGEFEASGANVIVMDSVGLTSIKFLYKLRRTLQRIKADTVQTHLLYSNILGGIASSSAGIPSAATLHARDDHPRFAKSPKRHIETLILKLCHRSWIAVANSVASSHQKRLPGKRMKVVENAVSLSTDIVIDSAQRSFTRQSTFKVPPDGNPAVWICVSRLVTIKGIIDLIDAFNLSLASRPVDRLVIIGSGPERNTIDSHIASLGISSQVIMLGHRRDVRELLLCADLFVSAAHSEGLPISLLEAMASRLPIVHTDVGEVGQIITAQCGALVPVKDPELFSAAVLRILNSGLQADMGNISFDIVNERFNAQQWISKLMLLLAGSK